MAVDWNESYTWLMERGLVILLIFVGVIFIAAVLQLIFNDRSGTLDDRGSGPIRHRERRAPGADSGQRRDHDW
jgi:hypothetical protein